MTTPAADTHQRAEDDEKSHSCIRSQDREMDAAMLKLNRRLRRLFRALPAGTLSVVLLSGDPSAHRPGLCLLEVKQDP